MSLLFVPFSLVLMFYRPNLSTQHPMSTETRVFACVCCGSCCCWFAEANLGWSSRWVEYPCRKLRRWWWWCWCRCRRRRRSIGHHNLAIKRTITASPNSTPHSPIVVTIRCVCNKFHSIISLFFWVRFDLFKSMTCGIGCKCRKCYLREKIEWNDKMVRGGGRGICSNDDHQPRHRSPASPRAHAIALPRPG